MQEALPPPPPWASFRKAAIPSLQWLCMDAFADFLSSSSASCSCSSSSSSSSSSASCSASCSSSSSSSSSNVRFMHIPQQTQQPVVLPPDLLERLLLHWKQSNRLPAVLLAFFSANRFVGPSQVHLDFSNCSALDAALLAASLSSGASSLLSSTSVRTIHLDLSRCCQLSDAQVDAVLRALSAQLCSLNLSHCSYITDDGLRALKHCSNLTSLSLASVPISSAAIHLVAESCTLLRHLDISSVKFTQCIIEDLGKLHELEVLLTSQTDIPSTHPKGLAHVFANCNKLRIVDLSNNVMASDDQLEALATHCPSLERITIDNFDHYSYSYSALEKFVTQLSKLEAMNILPSDASTDFKNSPCLREYLWDGGGCNEPLPAEYFFDPLEACLCNLSNLSFFYVDLQPHVLPMIARCCTNLVSFTMVYCSFTAESVKDMPNQRESLVAVLRNNVGLRVFKIMQGGRTGNICLTEQVIKQIGPSCPNLRTLHLSLEDGTPVSLHSQSLEELYIKDAKHVAFDIECPQLRLFSCTAFGMESTQLDLWKTLLFHGSTLQQLDINTLLPEMLAELSNSWLFPVLQSLTVHTVAQQPLLRKDYFTNEECNYLDKFLQERPHLCFPSTDFVNVAEGASYPYLCQRLESIDVTFERDQSFELIALNHFENLVSLCIMNTDHVLTTWIEALEIATPKLVDFTAFNNHVLTCFRLRHQSLRSIRLIHWHKLVEFELDCPCLYQIELDNCSLMSERALTSLSDNPKNNVPLLVDLWCQHDSSCYIEPGSRKLTLEEAIVIQSCPISVQNLSMDRTWHVVVLTLSCPKLRTLSLYDMEFLKVLSLDCPKLQTLTVDIAPSA
ncbi:putative VIER F-box protein 2 [Balamuthia mandrillaris]